MPEDDKDAHERTVPEQVLCRRTLRSNPPPILVTNVTMLEYLTVRRKDRPILDTSRGKLRWIILDEAHSYTGSNAAEIALLLRRVLLAFDVTPDQVRFVATSATIGEGADVTEELRRFLRDVSGAPEERVHVVVGHRRTPNLPPPNPGKSLGGIDVSELDASTAFDRLACNPVVQNQVAELTRGARAWSTVARELSETGGEPEALALALARAEKGGERLLPLRVHAFHRAVPGLWTCLDPDCADRVDGWPFGGLLPEALGKCPACGGRVLPVVPCRSCGEPFLDAVEESRILRSRDEDEREDHYARDSEEESAASSDDEGARSTAPGIERLIWQVSHDWRSDDDRAEVTEAVAAGLGLKGSLILKRDRHAREMVLTFDDSTSVTLVFDQGFGCWAGPKGIPLRFDFDADPRDQAAKLMALNAVVQGPSDPPYIVAHR